jgi:hypothetical protein
LHGSEEAKRGRFAYTLAGGAFDSVSVQHRFFQLFHDFNKHVFSEDTFVVAVGLRSLLRPAM